jgi:hypothetical protein
MIVKGAAGGLIRMRIAGTLIAVIIAATVAGCGDNTNTNGGGRSVTPGFFIGETASHEDLSIAVGSIRAVFFRCAGQSEYERFDPPEPIAGDGAFAVEMHSNGITFVVTGEITDDDRIDGAIAGNSGCHGTFVAHRCDPQTQDCGDRDGDLIPNEVDPDTTTSPTPQRTPTAAVTASATVIGSASATPATTASGGPTPTATATPNSALCGNGVLDEGEECDKNAIDNSGCFEDVCTCEDFCDDAGGTLSCNANCTVNFSKCTAGDCSF